MDQWADSDSKYENVEGRRNWIVNGTAGIHGIGVKTLEIYVWTEEMSLL